jgi:hypothetical protein
MTLGELSKVFHVGQTISIRTSPYHSGYNSDLLRVIPGCCLRMDSEIKALYQREIESIGDDCSNCITIYLKPEK